MRLTTSSEDPSIILSELLVPPPVIIQVEPLGTNKCVVSQNCLSTNVQNDTDEEVCVLESSHNEIATIPKLAVSPECLLYNKILEKMCKSPSFIMKELAGKGIGMVAKRKLYPGDLILAEKPLFFMPEAVFEDVEAAEEWLDKAVNNLSSQQREIFMCLSDCRNPEDPNYLGRFYTNCMYYDTSYTVVCPIMARANHSCKPNAEFVDRVDLGVNELRAMYVVEPGEEIMINYLAMAEEGCDVREVRRDYLRRFYGFQCTCRACTLQGKALEDEEALRENLKELQALGTLMWTPEEVAVFVSGMYKIQGKLSNILELMKTCFNASDDQMLKLKYCMHGLSLSISLFGEESKQTHTWKQRSAELCPLALWAGCCLRYE